MSSNPYVPPSADVTQPASAAEADRQEHIEREAAVRSIGMLYYLGAGLMGLFGLSACVISLMGTPTTDTVGPLLIGVVYLGLATLSFFLARGIRALRRWARTTAIVLGVIGLLGFPLGTLINGYILYLLLSAKGKRLFEPDYPDVIAATPEVRYRTSLVVWIALAVLVALIAFAIIVPLLSQW